MVGSCVLVMLMKGADACVMNRAVLVVRMNTHAGAYVST
jgi:hypothetical protein